MESAINLHASFQDRRDPSPPTRPRRSLARLMRNRGDMHLRLMLAGVLAGQLADTITFAVGVGLHGIGLESNGFASLAYQWNGVGGVLLLKGAAILVTLAVLVASASRFRRLFVWGAATATGVGLLGMVTNVRVLLILG